MNISCGWSLAVLVLLAACGPSEKQKAQLVEQKRIECLDRFCDGDVEPKRDMLNEVAFKLNGKWFIGSTQYGNPNFGPMAFYWPSKAASGDAAAASKAQEIVRNKVGGVDNFYDVAIEISVSTKLQTTVARSTYQLLIEEEQQGRVIEKHKVRDGLHVWKTQNGNIEETWYVATNLKDPSGDPPVIACRGKDPTKSRCTGGFLWQPDIAVGLRFRATHGSDWPEIYLEIIRVLKLIRKA